MSEKTYQTLTFEVQGHVAKITLTRPEVLNRMDEVTSEELVHVIEKLRRPGDIRVVIIASTGACFSAGGDLEEVRRLATDKYRRFDAWDNSRKLIYGMHEIPVPVVVALQGDVYGLGASVALSGDVIIASKNVKIGDPHVRVGLSAGDGGTLVWPAAFGMQRTKRHLLTGDPINAQDAYMLGGVTDLVDTPEEVLPLAEKIAGRITELAPMAVEFTKRSINHIMHKQAVDAFEFSLALEQYALASEDVLEAVDAFKNKRKPVYKNR